MQKKSTTQPGRDIPDRELKPLLMKSGNMCAFPGCQRRLTEDGTQLDGAVVLGEMAHIIAFSPKGPRGDSAIDQACKNAESNLILVCRDHHTVIDGQPNTYSVAVLAQMKADHEAHVRSLTTQPGERPAVDLVEDLIHSTVLPVTHVPRYVFVAPTEFTDGDSERVAQRIHYPKDRAELVPFLLRDSHRLYAFHDLRDEDGPFSDVVDPAGADPIPISDFCRDAEGRRRFVTLLNSALTRHLGRLHLRFDREHKRFFFLPEPTVIARSVTYRPLNRAEQPRRVVWQPIRKSTGEPRPYWTHLAAALSFHHIGSQQWVLSIRPEFRYTLDGEQSLPSDQIGKKTTRNKSRMFNYDYLGEVQFWREFIAEGQPHIFLSFGAQTAVIDSKLLATNVRWPGIPVDAKPFKNVNHVEDLFTVADLDEAIGGDVPDLDELELDDEEQDYDDDDDDW